MPIDRQRDLLTLKGLVSGTITQLTDNEVQVDTAIRTSNVFRRLTNLEHVDTSRLSFVGNDIHYEFENCTELKYVRLPSVENIGNSMFSDCSKLQEVSMPLLSQVSANTFNNCSSLVTLDFPLLTEIEGSAFFKCTALSNINFPAVTNVGETAFYGCSGLTNVTLPNVTHIGTGCFSFCSNLVAIDFGASVITISSDGMYKCPSLLHLVIRNTNAVCTYQAKSAAADPSNSQLKIYVPRALLDSYKTATNWSRLADKFVALEDYTNDGTTTGELVT